MAWAGVVTSSSAGSVRSSGARIVALCDVDQAHLDREVEAARDQRERVAAHTDLRKVLDDKSIDAVVIATPNHWHALATIWACQAGKDVYVEKPFSYNIWEGRQMVAAARKYGRIVQVGTQKPLQPGPARGVRVPAERRARGHPLRARPGLPGARRHRQGRRADADRRPRSTTTSGAARRRRGR